MGLLRPVVQVQVLPGSPEQRRKGDSNALLSESGWRLGEGKLAGQ